MKCPIKSLKSWKDLVAVQSEELSYYLWDKYDGEVPEEYYTKKSDATNNIGIRPGVSELFESNHELSSIGSPQLYSKYLDTIFPESKVKDIVYHVTDVANIEQFKTKAIDKKPSTKFFEEMSSRDVKLDGAFFTDNKIAALTLYNTGTTTVYDTEFDDEGFPYEVEKVVPNPQYLYSTILKIINPYFGNRASTSNIDVVNNDSAILEAREPVEFIPNSGIVDYIGYKEFVVFEPEQIHILGSKQDIEGFKKFIRQSGTINQETKESISEGLKTSDNHVYQRSNEVQYKLKAVDILLSDKAKQIFAKGEKAKWDLNKILTELAVPKEQKQLLLDLGVSDREQLVLELANKYGYSVEVNTAKVKEGSIDEGFERIDGREEGQNTATYSNLTVPGGTNYTENEISTPLITPSIKGHAQFSTKNGIGWFRSDDRTHGGDSNLDWSAKTEANGEYDSNTNSAFTVGKDRYWIVTDSEVGVPMEFWDSYYKNGSKITEEEFYKAKRSSDNVSNVYDGTKTRRILEVQSDLFQKGRNIEDLSETKPTQNNIIVEKYTDGNTSGYKIEYKGDIYKSVEIEFAGVKYFKNGNFISNDEWNDIADEINSINKTQVVNKVDNQFLQLLNKDNNWVTFFIKSIIQDSAKKGYEKVLFPKGDTLIKIESASNYDSIETAKNANEENLVNTALFYEIKIGNILEKIFGKDNVKTITDEYGNQWREITIDESRDLSDILLQKPFDESDIKLNKSQLESLQKFADELESRFGTKFELISQEEAKSKFKGYIDEAGIYDPETKTAYLVKGVATKDTAIHEIFTHPFLESIKGSDLYNKLLEEAIVTKGVKEFVDKAYNEYSQDVRNDEYIARAIDLIVNRKESSPKLMDLVYKFFTKMANFINKLFNKELVKVQSINPNITLEQLSNYALYGRDRLAIDQITGINSLDDIMSILTNKSALEAFKISESTMSIEQFLKSVGIKDSMISDIADYYYESRPETYQQFVTGIHDTILSGKTVYFQRSNPEHHSTPETLAIAIKEKQLRGLRARLRVLEVRGTSTKEQISELETVIKTIDELEADKSSLEFIKYSKQKLNEAAKYLLTFETQRANGERINETNLMSLYQDFLKLFEESLSEMDMAERTNGAIFSSLDDEMKNTAKEELNALKTSYSNLLARFDILARYEFENMLGEISDRVNFTSKDEMLKDVYSIKSDVAFLKNKWLGLYVLSAERSSIPQLRALDKVISDIEEEIERKVDETGLIDELKSAIRSLSKTRAFSYSEFREKGEDGKDTGYLVSPLKWGMYSIKKRAFISKLNKKYNVDPKIGKPTNNEDFIAYNTELNEFLSENVERRLDNSYYEAKSKLSMHASIAMDYADDVLRKFEHQFLNEYGIPDTSKMSSKQKEVWLRLKKEKRDLASEYDSLGNIKVGQELETAKEIQAFREKFNGKLEFKQRNDVFEKVKEEKRKSLSKAEFDKWEKNNTVTRANQEFYDELAKLERADYGSRYEELMDRARAIEKRYRDPLTGDIDVDLMDSIYDSNGISVKQSLDELYIAAGIEKRNYKELNKVSPTKGFDKLAKFEITDAGNALKSRMQAMYDSGEPELMKEALAMREANFDLIEFVGWVPKRYYQKIVPVQKKHIETVPNAIWNDIDEESALYNKNYKEDLAQNNFHPKLSIYDSKKEYDKLISDEKKKKLYDTLLKIYEHGYSKFSYLTTEDKYRLPQIEGSFLRSVSARSGFFPKVKEALRQIFAIQEDESGYGDLGLSQYRADGSRLRLARTKYIQHIDNPAAISKNLGEIYSLFLIEAIRFQEVSKAEGKINLFQHAFSKTSVSPEDDSEQLVKSGETNLIKKAEDLINRNVYDEKKQIGTIKVPGTNYKISLTKPLFGMLQYAGAFVNLAFNKFAIWGNFSSAENNLLIEAHIGMDISKLDLLQSSSIVATELHNAVADLGISTVRCKQTLINNFYGLLGETNSNLVGRGANDIAGDISDLILFGGYTAGDYVVKSKMLDAMLLGFRYDPNENKFFQREEFASKFYPSDRKTGYKVFNSLKVSVYDALENKDGKIVVKDEYKEAYTNNLHSKIRSRADNLAARLDGILTRNSKSSLFSSAVGSAVMLNRQWILNVWMNLFGSGVYSFKEQRDIEGMYVTLAKYMVDNNHNNIAFVKNIGRLVAGKERELIEKNQLTAKERDAIRRIQAQFASIVVLSILASLMFRFSDDDEDSLFYTLGTMLLRTGTEISASVIPTDTWGFIQSPTAAKPLMDQFGELYELTLSGSLKDEVRSGPYKGESKAQQTLTKISPFKHLKEDWISPDIRKKKNYMEDQSSLVYPLINSLIGKETNKTRKKKEKKQAGSYFDASKWFDDKKK